MGKFTSCEVRPAMFHTAAFGRKRQLFPAASLCPKTDRLLALRCVSDAKLHYCTTTPGAMITNRRAVAPKTRTAILGLTSAPEN